MESKNFTIGACDISKHMSSRTQSTNPVLFCILDLKGVEFGKVHLYSVNLASN